MITKHQAITETLHLWKYIYAHPELTKCEAIRKSNSPAVDYLFNCPACQYVAQELGGNRISCEPCPVFPYEDRCSQGSANPYNTFLRADENLRRTSQYDKKNIDIHIATKKEAALSIVQLCELALREGVDTEPRHET